MDKDIVQQRLLAVSALARVIFNDVGLLNQSELKQRIIELSAQMQRLRDEAGI